MAEKHSYTVRRTMMGDGREYQRGENRKMTAAEAAPLLETGAISKAGEEPAERAPAVQHTFGTRPSEVKGYTTATGEGIRMPNRLPLGDTNADKAAADKADADQAATEKAAADQAADEKAAAEKTAAATSKSAKSK